MTDDDSFLAPLAARLRQLVRDRWAAWGYGPPDLPTAVAVVRRGWWAAEVIVLRRDGSVVAYRAPETCGVAPLRAEHVHLCLDGDSLDEVLAMVERARDEYRAPYVLPADCRPPRTEPWPYPMPVVPSAPGLPDRVRPSLYLRFGQHARPAGERR